MTTAHHLRAVDRCFTAETPARFYAVDRLRQMLGRWPVPGEVDDVVRHCPMGGDCTEVTWAPRPVATDYVTRTTN